LNVGHKSSHKAKKPRARFICLNVRSGLDPKDLEENVSGWSGYGSFTRWFGRKRCICIRDHLGYGGKVHRSARLWLGPYCQMGNRLRQSVVAAILVTARAGSFMRHVAGHAHMAHGPTAARHTGTTCWSPHIARQSREGRLGRKQRSHNNSDDLEEPFHLLEIEYDRQGDPGQVSHVTIAARSKCVRDSVCRKNYYRLFCRRQRTHRDQHIFLAHDQVSGVQRG